VTPRPSVHTLLADLDELRRWMIENGVAHARAGDLELHVELEWVLTPAKVRQEAAEEAEKERDVDPRAESDDPYEEIDRILGREPIKLTGKLTGENAHDE
jgi:hypothetical protein